MCVDQREQQRGKFIYRECSNLDQDHTGRLMDKERAAVQEIQIQWSDLYIEMKDSRKKK